MCHYCFGNKSLCCDKQLQTCDCGNLSGIVAFGIHTERLLIAAQHSPNLCAGNRAVSTTDLAGYMHCQIRHLSKGHLNIQIILDIFCCAIGFSVYVIQRRSHIFCPQHDLLCVVALIGDNAEGIVISSGDIGLSVNRTLIPGFRGHIIGNQAFFAKGPPSFCTGPCCASVILTEAVPLTLCTGFRHRTNDSGVGKHLLAIFAQ